MGTTPPITTNNPQNPRSTKPDQTNCSSEFYGVPLTHAMQYDLQDLLKKYKA